VKEALKSQLIITEKLTDLIQEILNFISEQESFNKLVAQNIVMQNKFDRKILQFIEKSMLERRLKYDEKEERA